MKRLTKIIVGIIVIIILVSISMGIYIIYTTGGWDNNNTNPSMFCKIDLTNKTLTVTGTTGNLVYWSDVRGSNHIAGTDYVTSPTLPTGTVEKGDVITNCSGRVTLVYKPRDSVLGSWDFEE